MKAIDKVTHRHHSICPVLGGYQVCLIPGLDFDDANIEDIHVFLDEDFFARFDLVQ
jgi:hypothetical protein